MGNRRGRQALSPLTLQTQSEGPNHTVEEEQLGEGGTEALRLSLWCPKEIGYCQLDFADPHDYAAF